jgi:hypothetical protein
MSICLGKNKIFKLIEFIVIYGIICSWRFLIPNEAVKDGGMRNLKLLEEDIYYCPCLPPSDTIALAKVSLSPSTSSTLFNFL